MSNIKLQHLRSPIPNVRPTADKLVDGQLFLNTGDGTISFKLANSEVVTLSSEIELSDRYDNLLDQQVDGLLVSGYLTEGNISAAGEYPPDNPVSLIHAHSREPGLRPTYMQDGQIFVNNADGVISIVKDGQTRTVVDIGGGGSGNVVSFGLTEPHPAPPLRQNSIISGGANITSPSADGLVALGNLVDCAVLGVAIGSQANGGPSGTSIGYKATSAMQSVAIGAESKTTSAGAIAIGLQTEAGPRAIAIGPNATATSWESIAIGTRIDNTNSTNGISIGKFSALDAANGIAIGYEAATKFNDSIAIGTGATTISENQLSIGAFTPVVDGEDNITGYTLDVAREIVGLAAPTRADSATNKQYVDSKVPFDTMNQQNQPLAAAKIDHLAQSMGALAIGWGATSKNGSQAWGTETKTEGNNAVGLGIHAQAIGIGNTAIGSSSFAYLGGYNTAVGYASKASNKSVAVGGQADAGLAGTVAIGYQAKVVRPNTITFVKLEEDTNLSLAPKRICGVALPEDEQDVATKAYVDHTKIFSATLTQMLTEVESGSLYVPTDLTATNVLDVPVDADVKVGHRVDIVGPVEVVPEVGVTIRSADNKKKVVANQAASLIKIAANEFVLIGSLED